MNTRSPQGSRWRTRTLAAVGTLALGFSMMTATTALADVPESDPREGLTAGLHDAEQAASNIALLSAQQKTSPFTTNSDLAFTGDYAIAGNYYGFQIYDISDPAAPTLDGTFVCPGGQGDVSVFGDLLFMSVESGPGRLDCGTVAVPATDPQTFRGVRVFDISDITSPVQIAAVQTCRGSHTHTVVEDPDDAENVYVYVSGTAGVRTTTTALEGCVNPVTANTEASHLDADGNPIDTARFQVEVIKVPLADPASAAVVNEARLFVAESGSPAGLWPGGSHGEGFQSTSATDACHDITAYPEIGLAAGACEGNGILIDISDPVNPVRLDAVTDPRFAYWHSATFNNDGTKVVFTDEWGGGSSPRCRAEDPKNWGANAIFDIVDGKLEFRSYYKMPAIQTAQENCVAHNGSLIPVPGRDIMVQAWYQGGLSVFDFTDSANPVEIAYFDRGPNDATRLVTGGYWSTYWYNGNVFGNEIGRGFDSLALQPSAQLSANEIAAAGEYTVDLFNAQAQPRYEHAPSFSVVRSYVDQAERAGTLTDKTLTQVRKHLDEAQVLVGDGSAGNAIVAQLDNAAKKSGAAPDSDLIQALTALMSTFS